MKRFKVKITDKTIDEDKKKLLYRCLNWAIGKNFDKARSAAIDLCIRQILYGNAGYMRSWDREKKNFEVKITEFK
jgi:hypothetical protein